MNNQEVIVCERSGLWATALRRALNLTWGLCETRSWAACERELQARAAALVAVEVSAENAEAACGRMARLTSRFPRVPVVVLADRKLRHVEWLLREAGAVDVVYALSDLPRLRIVLARFQEQTPSNPPGFREMIQSRLPWRQHATTMAPSPPRP